MANKVKGIIVQIGGDTTGLTKALGEVNKKTASLQSELKQVDKLLKFDPKNVDLLSQKQKLLTDAVSATKEKLDALKQAQEQASQKLASGEIGQDQYRELQREIIATEQQLKRLVGQSDDTENALREASGGATDGLQQLESQADKTGNALDNVVGTSTQQLAQLEEQADKTKTSLTNIADNMGKFGENTTRAGSSMMPVTVGIVGAGTAALMASNNLDDAMAKVYTIADESVIPVEDMKDQIIALSDATGVSVDALAEDVYNAISAGQSTGDAIGFLTNSTKLAKGGFAESAQALDILTTTLNAYEMESSEATRVSDMLVETQNKGKTTVGQLATSMGKIIPTAKGQNVALEQLCTSYAIMTSNGIATAETTTYLNSMLNELGKSGTVASDALNEATGQSFSQLMDSGKSLADVLAILDEEAGESGVALTDMFGSAEAGKAAFTLIGGGVDEFNAGVKDMQNSSGATQRAFEKMQTPAEEFRQTLNKLKNSFLDFGVALQPLFKKLTDAIKGLADKIRGMSTEQVQAAIKIAMVAAAIGPLLIAIGKLSTGIGTTIKVVQTLWITFSAHPIGLLITALGLLVGAFIIYNDTLGETSEEVAEIKRNNDELCESTEKLHDEIDKERESREKNIEDIETQIGVSRNLMDQLFDLSEKESLSNDEKARMKVLVDQLNDTVPDLNLAFDEQTGVLNMQRGEVDALITSHEKMLKVQAAQKDLITIAENMYKADKKRADLIKQNQSTIEKRNQFQKEYDELIKKSATSGASVADSQRAAQLSNNLDDLQAEINQTNEVFRENEAETQKLQTEWNNTETYIVKNNVAMQESAETMALLDERTRMLNGNTSFSAEEFAALEQKIIDSRNATDKAVESNDKLIISGTDVTEALKLSGLSVEEFTGRLEEYGNMAQNAFDKIAPAAKISVDQLTENLESNAKTVNDWADNLTKAAERGIDKGLIQKLRDAGPEMSTTVAGLVGASDEQIKKLNTAYQKGGEVAVNALLAELGAPEVKIASSDMVDDLADGVAENDALKVQAETTVTETKTAFVKKVEDSDFNAAGTAITKAIAAGICNGQSEVINAVVAVVNAARNVAGDSEGVKKNIAKQKSINNYNRYGTPMLANGGTLFRGDAIVGEIGPELLSVVNGRAVVRPLTMGEKAIPTVGNVSSQPTSYSSILQAIDMLTQAVKAGQSIELDGYKLGRVVRNMDSNYNTMLGRYN